MREKNMFGQPLFIAQNISYCLLFQISSPSLLNSTGAVRFGVVPLVFSSGAAAVETTFVFRELH